MHSIFPTELTAAYVIATPKELTSTKSLRVIDNLKKVVPNLQIFRARDIHKDGPSISVSPCVWHNIKHKRKHWHSDVSTYGELGCADSHAELWRRASKDPNPDGWTLIFEADAVPTSYLKRLMAKDKPAWPALDDCSGVLLGSTIMMPYTYGARAVSNDVYVVNQRFCGTHAYAVRNKNASALLAAVLPLDTAVDTGMAIANKMGTIPTLWTTKHSAFRQPFAEVIHSVHLKSYLSENDGAVLASILVPWTLVLAAVIALIVMGVRRARSKFFL